MKLQKLAGATSEIWQLFIADSSSTTGAGLTGLTSSSSGLTAYYHRDTDTTATAITLTTMTVGTFTSSGFKEIDATNMAGWYQFCPPNAALASGAKSVAVHLKGVTNMAPLPIEVQLMAVNPDSATAFMTSLATVTTTTNLTNPPTAGDFTSTMKSSISTAVLSATASSFNVAGTIGNKINSAASAGDPWATTLPGSYTTGQAGYIVGTNVDTTVSSRLAPTTAGRTLDVAAGGEAGLDFNNIAVPVGPVPAIGFIDNGVAQSATSTTVVLRSAANFGDNTIVGNTVAIIGTTQNYWQARQITGYVASTKTATVDAFTVTPGGTLNYYIYATPPGSATSLPPVNVLAWNGTTVATPATAGVPDVNVKQVNAVSTSSVTTIAAVQGTTQPLNFTGTGSSALVKGDTIDLAGQTVSAASGVTFPSSVASPTNITAGTITTATNLTNAPTSGDLTATMKASVSTAVLSATASSFNVSGTIGEKINSAASAGDPWSTLIPGSYGAGTAGNILGNKLDAQVSTRLAPTVAGRTLDVSTGGEAGLDWANVGSPTTALNLSSTLISQGQKVDVNTIKTQAVTAGSAVTFPDSIASQTNITGGTITTVTNVTNAPTTGDLTSTMKASVTAAVLDVTASAHNTAGTIGASINAAASAGDPWTTNLPGSYVPGQAGYLVGTGVPVAGDLTSTMKTSVGAAVLDASASAHNTAGTVGNKINAAASAGDPWGTALPGSYADGTAGQIVGEMLDATVGSRAQPGDQMTVNPATVVSADVKKINAVTITGAGTSGSPFEPA